MTSFEIENLVDSFKEKLSTEEYLKIMNLLKKKNSDEKQLYTFRYYNIKIGIDAVTTSTTDPNLIINSDDDDDDDDDSRLEIGNTLSYTIKEKIVSLNLNFDITNSEEFFKASCLFQNEIIFKKNLNNIELSILKSKPDYEHISNVKGNYNTILKYKNILPISLIKIQE